MHRFSWFLVETSGRLLCTRQLTLGILNVGGSILTGQESNSLSKIALRFSVAYKATYLCESTSLFMAFYLLSHEYTSIHLYMR
jgi:hypothetical protein